MGVIFCTIFLALLPRMSLLEVVRLLPSSDRLLAGKQRVGLSICRELTDISQMLGTELDSPVVRKHCSLVWAS
jgi:hypothetical protein